MPIASIVCAPGASGVPEARNALNSILASQRLVDDQAPVDGVLHELGCPRDGVLIVRWTHASTAPPYANFSTCFNPPPAGGTSRGYMIFAFPRNSVAVDYLVRSWPTHATPVHL